MNQVISPAPVRHAVTVEAAIERAFEVFTSQFGLWWPASHKIGASPMKTAVIEPRVGGRWYEIGEDGAECQWGDVLAWEPPHRVLLAWRIGADWRFDAGLLTEVEVKFVALEAGRTRVELEHRLLENMGDAAAAARATFDSDQGWRGILGGFVEQVRPASRRR
jgi:uncharacterized protein YndB with AHSA1/START domain